MVYFGDVLMALLAAVYDVDVKALPPQVASKVARTTDQQRRKIIALFSTKHSEAAAARTCCIADNHTASLLRASLHPCLISLSSLAHPPIRPVFSVHFTHFSRRPHSGCVGHGRVPEARRGPSAERPRFTGALRPSFSPQNHLGSAPTHPCFVKLR